VIRGINVLFSGLQEHVGQERVHQFVRAIEALLLPDTGKTKKQFVSRCQTFASPGPDTVSVLQEAFDMRSDTEHLQDWNRAVLAHPVARREDVCLQRTRQMEQLACGAYSRLLQNAALWAYFHSDADIADFWKLPEDHRRAAWGPPLDISAEPLCSKYHPIGRAME